MRVRCLTVGSWHKAASGECNEILVSQFVPPLVRFSVYVGKRSCPEFVDGRARFLSLGSKRVGFGVWRVRVKVLRGKSV